MGDTITQYHEIMSDREIMDAKNPRKKIQEFIDDEVNQTITIFEEEYPELSEEFKKIQKEPLNFIEKIQDSVLDKIVRKK